MLNFNAFREWQLKGNRSVKIEMGKVADIGHLSVWVFDYDLLIGQFVTSIEEIDLIEQKKKRLRRNIAELEDL